jgi:hypothetical protein
LFDHHAGDPALDFDLRPERGREGAHRRGRNDDGREGQELVSLNDYSVPGAGLFVPSLIPGRT